MFGITRSEAVSLIRKFITSKSRVQGIRSLVTRVVPNDDKDGTGKVSRNVIAKKIENPSKDMKKIYEYFKDDDLAGQADALPSRIITQRKSKPEYLYLFDSSIAKSMIDLIKGDLLTDPTNVVEVNAGMGFLTRELLAAGVPLLKIMEPNVKFIRILAELQQIYTENIIIREADLFNVWKLAYQDKHDGGERVANLFADLPHVEWGEKLGLNIIGTVTNIHFIRHMMMDIVRQSGLVSYGRPRLYLCLPPSTWLRLTCDNTAGINEYRSLTVLFQLLFDYELLGKVPRQAFLPWVPSYSAKSAVKVSKKHPMDKDYMYIVRMEGKKNLFQDIIDPKLIQPLWYFVNHHLVSRTGRVIPQMETWQPGCGQNLIMQDMNIFTQFGDLSPQELLDLFKIFTTWDGFQNSFIPSMENTPQKMEQLTY